MNNMSNSGLALLITPMLPTILLSFTAEKGFYGSIYLALIIYSFYLAFYLIVENKETDID